MIDFKIQGVDILPDVIGYIFFAVGFSILAANSTYFIKARNFNIPMIILSLFSIYEKPAQGGGIQFGQFGVLSVILSIAALIIGLLVVYNLFMGIKEMAEIRRLGDIYEEAATRWNQYLLISIAGILGFILMFIPILLFAYIIVMLILSLVITFSIMRFMAKCSESLNNI
jgi:hypothetical protein